MSDSHMPPAVKAFAALYYSAAALQLAIMLRGFGDYPEIGTKSRAFLDSPVGLATLAIMFSLFVVVPALMTWLAASRRQNWARVALAVMFGLGMCSGLPPMATVTINKLDFATVRFLVLTALQAPALCLIFSPAVKGWFVRSDMRVAQA